VSDARARLAVALDLPDRESILAAVRDLAPEAGVFKLGLEAFVSQGPGLVREIASRGRVFLDLKLHDIPTTVERALERLLDLDPRLINVHAQGGPAMLRAAAEVVEKHRARGGQTKLLAVTVLTSLDREALAGVGYRVAPSALALDLARLAKACGCDGVVCSAHEAASVRAACGEGFHRLTPGIRPLGGGTQDQARVMDPLSALRAGATWLVVGRPITHAPDPAAAADSILRSMESAG
jgi:orotidine-5'-phosphate decarboxylase